MEQFTLRSSLSVSWSLLFQHSSGTRLALPLGPRGEDGGQEGPVRKENQRASLMPSSSGVFLEHPRGKQERHVLGGPEQGRCVGYGKRNEESEHMCFLPGLQEEVPSQTHTDVWTTTPKWLCTAPRSLGSYWRVARLLQNLIHTPHHTEQKQTKPSNVTPQFQV